MLTNIVNALIDIIVVIANGALLLLPDTPFKFEPLEWGEWGTAIAYVFPISGMATSLALILSACLVYYAVRALLRLIRQVQ